jgi:hypothetical protein
MPQGFTVHSSMQLNSQAYEKLKHRLFSASIYETQRFSPASRVGLVHRIPPKSENTCRKCSYDPYVPLRKSMFSVVSLFMKSTTVQWQHGNRIHRISPKSVEVYGKSVQKYVHIHMLCMTVIVSIFAKLRQGRENSVKNCYSKFLENPSNGLVPDIRTQTDGLTRSAHKTFFYLAQKKKS